MTRRGLSDLRTATSSRLHAKPPQKGTTYLDLYLLDKERQRLHQELERLEHHHRRIQAHLAEIDKAMIKLKEAQGGEASEPSPEEAAKRPAPPSGEDGKRGRLWKKMAVGY